MKAIKVEFTEKNLTGNAGLVHFGRFIDKLKLHERLNSHLSITRATNADLSGRGCYCHSGSRCLSRCENI